MSAQSRFQVIEDQMGTYPLIKITDSESGEYVSLLPTFGGTITEMIINVDGSLKSIIDGY